MSDFSDPHSRTNGFNGDQVQGFLDQIAKLDDELLSLKGSYMESCKAPRSRIKDVMGQVRESGINIVAFRELLAKHRDDRKRQARIQALEDDDRDAYEMLLESLGEFGNTPLGQAALARARPKQDGGDTLDELHQS